MDNLPKKNLPIPIGIDDYKEIIETKYLYIDKTFLIQEFWNDAAKVILITRPRRFGKTIALSMLRYFFEKTETSHSYLFENSAIWQEEKFQKLQGTYPVIFISFKDIKGKTWETAYQEIQELLIKELKRTLKPLLHVMDHDSKAKYISLINKTANEAEFNGTLLFITEIFNEFYKKKTIILLDEYDSPITYAYLHKYYDDMVGFMRNLLSKALKGNDCLHRCLMTGIVRTARDGILSGLNNLDIYTILDSQFSDKFGFTEKEIDELLKDLDLSPKKEELKSWYNGYVIGAKQKLSNKMYNPWSVLNYIKKSCTPDTYWANTGSTELLEKLIAQANEETQNEIKLLIERKPLENKEIDQDVILLRLDQKEVEPWSFLLFAGYITAIDHIFKNNKHYYTLSIPNQEIAELYNRLVKNALSKNFSSQKLEKLLEALILGDEVIVSYLLGEFVGSFCSSHDLPQNDLERSLHLFVLGLLVSLSETYIIESNLESGHGRYDIMLCPRLPNLTKKPGILLEFKKGKSAELELLAQEGLNQIKTKNYPTQLQKLGHLGDIFCYGIASYKKELFVKKEVLSY